MSPGTHHTRSCWLREDRLCRRSHSSHRKHWLHTRFASKQGQRNYLSSDEMYLGVGTYWSTLLTETDSSICLFIKDIFNCFKFGMIPEKIFLRYFTIQHTFLATFYYVIPKKSCMLLKFFFSVVVHLKRLKNIEINLLLFSKSSAWSVSSLTLSTCLGR